MKINMSALELGIIQKGLEDKSTFPKDEFLIARLDGRGFTALAERVQLNRPFDGNFAYKMQETCDHLLHCGFKIIVGYTQSDEITLVLDPSDDTFGRRKDKLMSTLAGEASGKMSLLLGLLITFDCRIISTKEKSIVLDSLNWRRYDAKRNAINSYMHYTLISRGYSGRDAHTRSKGMTGFEKTQWLKNESIVDIYNMPKELLWQTQGVAFYWGTIEHEGYNPKTNEFVPTVRNKVFMQTDLEQGLFFDKLFSNYA